MKLFCGLFLSVFLISVITPFSNAKFPADIERCKHEDSICMTKVTNYIFQKYASGLPALNLVTIDPLFVNNINIEQGSESPVNIKLNFNNISILGLSKAVISNIVGFPQNPEGVTNELFYKAPKFVISGPYKMNGRVLILPVQGEGHSNLTLLEPEGVIKFNGKLVEVNGKSYYKPSNLKISLSTKRLHMNFENLFNGDPQLGPTTNNFLNENWEDIFNELKPAILKAFGQIINNVVSNVFARYPYNELFLQ